jgi:predicted Rossmann-fold nucleotide-binding protein
MYEINETSIKTMKTIIVTGGRNYQDFAKIGRVFDFLGPHLLVEGGALGADRLAREWAEYNYIDVITFYADWDSHGKAAGPIRNRKMLEEHPDAIVVAFPGGKGTENCVKQAKELGRVVLRVE